MSRRYEVAYKYKNISIVFVQHTKKEFENEMKANSDLLFRQTAKTPQLLRMEAKIK